MAFGPATSWQLTARWDGVTFVDETLGIDAGAGVHITRGRASLADDLQPGVLSATLYNQDGRYTADNPLSPLSLKVQDGVWTRFSVTRGGNTSFRHRGRLSISAPDLPAGVLTDARAALQSVDMLGTISQTTLNCDWVEQWINLSQTQAVDLFPLDENVDRPGVLRNLGSRAGTARVVASSTRAGTAATEAPDGVALDGSVVLTPSTAGVGPVIAITTDVPVGSVNNIMFTFRSTDRTAAAGPDKYLAVGLDGSGAALWSIRMDDNAGQCDINAYDAAGVFRGTILGNFSSVGEEQGADEWHLIQLVWFAGSQLGFAFRSADNVQAGGATLTSIDIRGTRTVVIGGLVAGSRTLGKQTACVNTRVGAVVISDSTNSARQYLQPNAPTVAQTRFTDMNLYCNFASAQSGTRNKPVLRKSTSGRTGFDVVAELVRTTGAVVVASRATDGTLLWFDADLQRVPTVALTVDVDQDVDAAGGFPWRKGDVPSKVTATWPEGSVVYQDPTRPRIDGNVDTCAADAQGAADVASAIVNSSRRLRLEKLVIDLSTASNDLWVAVMTLEIGARIRVNLGTATSLATAQYGVEYVDVYAVGWTEHYGQTFAFWEIQTVPADDPFEAVVDGLDGRVCPDEGAMTATAGTIVGTGLGTLIVTTSSGPALSTDAADYPCDFGWNGEDITVATPPASATSPQTVTVTARGVGATVARTHGAGEPFTVRFPGAATI